MPLPTKDEIQLENPTLQGVLATGYDDDAQRITILNSWGSSFGNDGYFYMHYDYILNKNRLKTFGRLKKLVKSNVPCREIGRYFDIKF